MVFYSPSKIASRHQMWRRHQKNSQPHMDHTCVTLNGFNTIKLAPAPILVAAPVPTSAAALNGLGCLPWAA